MGRISNIILIVITVLSLGIALGVLIKYRNVENKDIAKEVTVASEAAPELIDESESYQASMAGPGFESTDESELTYSNDPFEESLDSVETAEHVKSILKGYFSYQIRRSGHETIFKPFDDKIRNIPSSINYSQYTGYARDALPPEVQKILANSGDFPYELIENIINNFQLVNCQKGVSYSSKIMYTCSFILPTLDGTGLYTQVSRIPVNGIPVNIMPSSFEVKIIKEEAGYTVESFD